MRSQRQVSSDPLPVTSEYDAIISEHLRDLAFNTELNFLREIALVVRRGLKSFEEMTNHRNTKLDFKKQVAEFESLLIRNALIRTGGHQRRAAEALGLKASTLNQKIKRYGIDLSIPTNDSDVEAS